MKISTLLLVLSAVLLSKAQITVNLDAKWKQTHITSEISEFIAEKAPEYFWDFVENVETVGNDQEDYENCLSEASKLIDSSQISFLKLSMSMRKYSPKVQLHYTIGKSNICLVYFKYGDQKECNLENIVIKDRNEEKLYDFDHIYSKETSNLIIAYGQIGSSELKTAIKQLKKYVENGKLTSFVLRHHITNRSNDPVSLSGYGVELVMKNTEYKAIDEEKEVDPKDLHGLNILKLKLLHPNLTNEFSILRDHLQKIDDFSKPLKQWEMKSLSVQASRKIMESENPLDTLKEIIQDFPLHSRKLSQINVDDWKTEIFDDLKKGTNELRINGKKIENDVSIYELMNMLEKEKELVDRMFEIGVTDPLRLLSSINSELEVPSAIFDYRKGDPVYLNNVENEYGYPSIRIILHTEQGQILPIAKNIFTLIFVLDRNNPNEEHLFDFAKSFIEKTRFVRVGIISEKASDFLNATGLFKTPRVMMNGELIKDLGSLEHEIMKKINHQTRSLQFMIYNDMVDESEKIEDQWLDKLTKPLPRLHYSILDAKNSKKVLKIPRKSSILQKVKYSISTKSPIVIWIVGDFQNTHLRQYAAKITNWIGQKYKVGLISNTGCTEDEALDLNCEKELNDIVGITPGSTAIVVNSLVFGPLKSEELLKRQDFELIFKVLLKNRINTEHILEFSSIFYQYVKENRISRRAGEGVLVKETLENSPKLSITWVVNPTSRESQYLISIVQLIRDTFNCEIRLVFNPEPSLSSLPIDRFYRYVIANELIFEENGSIRKSYSHFDNLPKKQLMTLGMITHDSWMIELQTANYDLDNILIESNKPRINAGYSLENLLIEGTCSNKFGYPASGTQIEVQDSTKNIKYDTIVMENFGYFQLKANPGMWNLKVLNGDTISAIDGKPEFDQEVVIDSLNGRFLRIEVNKTSETTSSDDEYVSFFDKVKRYLPGFASDGVSTSDEINVFSLASGHLYERFIKIMMLSVMKNTKSKKVTFWLLKNYASPEFKQSIPDLARKYGFNVNFVEYRWPKWLNKQTEKQRIMWGYKILFLDVLFPLNVDKIIFVDADQVVRADLNELMKYDLEGAPYGYVPFCDSRKEMDGFRFWKSDYWNHVMGGRTYHISALYVVDLKQFRKMTAGDKLRAQYHMLSADPNSLANLDQDLPNYMIRHIPIKSLPQEWLWCETWCDDESKTNAKTIDLCNNPLTKEPKLNAAVRIIKEWKDLDRETREFTNKPLKIDL